MLRFSEGIKLLNPFCFSGFVKEIFNFHLNQKVSLAAKRVQSEKALKRNVHEACVTALLFLDNNLNENRLRQDVNYCAMTIGSLQKKLSEGMLRVLHSVLVQSNGQMSLTDFKKLLRVKPQSELSTFYDNLFKKQVAPDILNINFD